MSRPYATANDPTERKTITMRRSTWAHVEQERQPRESVSACIDRLISEAKKEGKNHE